MTPAAGEPGPVDIVAGDFTAGFEAGVEAGLTVGWQQGWAAHVDLTQLRFGLVAQLLDQPTHARLTELRAWTNQPCSRGAKCRTCSRCLRYAAAFRNQQAHGSPDFPGGVVPPW